MTDSGSSSAVPVPFTGLPCNVSYNRSTKDYLIDTSSSSYIRYLKCDPTAMGPKKTTTPAKLTKASTVPPPAPAEIPAGITAAARKSVSVHLGLVMP
jgi:hypothetical protein